MQHFSELQPLLPSLDNKDHTLFDKLDELNVSTSSPTHADVKVEDLYEISSKMKGLLCSIEQQIPSMERENMKASLQQ